MNNKLKIVIPVYKRVPDASERLSYKQYAEVLGGKFPVSLIAPRNLDLTEYHKIHKADEIITLAPEHFKSLQSYNRLVLSREFYELYSDMDYILIYQLDAILFKDDIEKWMNSGLDYIGAPWVNDRFRIFLNLLVKVNIGHALKYLLKSRSLEVGNGGLTLRKVSTFLSVFDYLKTDQIVWNANEDYYWSFFARTDSGFLKKPAAKLAISFAFEMHPQRVYKLNNEQLPMGTHAWEKHDATFWRNQFKKLGLKYE